MAPVSRSSDKFIIRLPDGMREQIKASAARNFRSMNSEILFHLLRAFPVPINGGDVKGDEPTEWNFPE